MATQSEVFSVAADFCNNFTSGIDMQSPMFARWMDDVVSAPIADSGTITKASSWFRVPEEWLQGLYAKAPPKDVWKIIGAACVACICAFFVYRIWPRRPKLKDKEEEKEGKDKLDESESDDGTLSTRTVTPRKTRGERETFAVGLQEILISGPRSPSQVVCSPATQRLSMRDLVTEVQTKSHQVQRLETELVKKGQEIDDLRAEVDDFEKKLDKVDELRRNAEAERDLMQAQLQKLQQSESSVLQEVRELQQQLKQTQIEMQLLQTSTNSNGSDSDTLKIQGLIQEIRREQEKSKIESQRLKDTIKTLLQKTVVEQKHKERLLKEIADLKSQVSTVSHVPNPQSDQDETSPRGSIWGFQPRLSWRTRNSTEESNRTGYSSSVLFPRKLSSSSWNSDDDDDDADNLLDDASLSDCD